jgi:ABC-type uncharacterized transport system substrate-binding protein
LVAKRLELPRELAPRAARVALLLDPSNVGLGGRTEKEVKAAARALGLQIQTLNATSSREIVFRAVTFGLTPSGPPREGMEHFTERAPNPASST